MVTSVSKNPSWSKIIKTKETILFLIIASIIASLDQSTKFFIELLKPNIQIGFINITYSTNTGAGFGILQNSSFILGIISAIAAIAVIYHYPKLPQTKIYSLLTGLFLGGIIGNGIDRLTKEYVVDFLATSFWPSFNVADSAITIAAVGFILLVIQEEITIKKKS
ncbi:signal peptidase II [archaeon]|jgi:signal peptidase II|nr:signal peptidase II [archaeon]MBT6762154.1 signal peptidase II [archaeon]